MCAAAVGRRAQKRHWQDWQGVVLRQQAAVLLPHAAAGCGQASLSNTATDQTDLSKTATGHKTEAAEATSSTDGGQEEEAKTNLSSPGSDEERFHKFQALQAKIGSKAAKTQRRLKKGGSKTETETENPETQKRKGLVQEDSNCFLGMAKVRGVIIYENVTQWSSTALEFHGFECCGVVLERNNAHAPELARVPILQPPDVCDITDVLEVVAHRVVVDGPGEIRAEDALDGFRLLRRWSLRNSRGLSSLEARGRRRRRRRRRRRGPARRLARRLRHCWRRLRLWHRSAP